MIVFYADDDPDDRDFFTDAIKEIKSNASVVTAKDGKEIINRIEDSGKIPDFIFLDLNMPVMSGKECLLQLRKREKFRNVPIIIYTTTSNKEECRNLILLGARDCITKGTTFPEIKAKLMNALSS